MSDKLGKGVYEVTADATGFKAGIADAKQAHEQFVASTAKNAEKAAAAVKKAGQAAGDAVKEPARQANDQVDKLDASAKRLATTIRRLGDQAGIPRSQYLENRARQAGIFDLPGVSDSIQKIRQSEQVVTKLGMSAKQTAQAMRLLPAQITDIVVGLASGQPAYLVAIQQGGQLKDSFGGIIPAARALLSVFTPLRLAMGGGVAVIAALVKAYADGSREADMFNRALINSGNIIGMTAGQMAGMAQAVSGITGTQSAAAEALSALVQFGGVGSENLVRFAATAVETQRRVGVAVEDTAKAFAELGKEPLKASEKLNEQQRYLTLAIYEQIKALEEQGRTAEAANVAQRAYADSQDERNRRLEASLGDYQRAWERLGAAAKKAWDWMLNIGREPDPREALASAEARLQSMLPGGSAFGRFSQSEIDAERERVKMLRQRVDTTEGLARAQGDYNRIQQAGIEAAKYLDKFASKESQRRKETEEFNKRVKDMNDARRLNGQAELTSAEVEAMRKNMLAKFSSGSGRSRAYTDDAATRMLQSARETGAALQAQLDGEEKLGAAARARVEFEQKIADLKTKGTLTADQKSLLANADKIRYQLETNEALEREVSIRKTIADQQKAEADAEAKFAERAAQIRQEIATAREGRLEQYGRQLGAFGKSDFEREMVSGQNDIFREFQRRQAQLLKSTPDHLLGSDKYIADAMAIKAALDQALADHETYYARLRQEQGNWENGYKRAMANYIQAAGDIAGQTERLFGNLFKGLEDVFTDFFTTGKANWREFGTAIVAEINRIIIRSQIIGPLAQSMQAGGGNFLTSFIGSIVGGAGGSGIGYGTAGTAAATNMVSDGAGGFVFANAKGSVFDPSGFTKFAAGGVVMQPTLFNYGGGGRGVMGEAGYEAIMPVARTSSGELGVKVAAKESNSKPTVINMTVVTRDAESFRRSEGQIKSRLAGWSGGAQRFA